MPVPIGQDLEELCIILTVSPQQKCITFPGGAEICVQMPGIPRDTGELTRQLLAQANAAMAPLVPIFNIIDAIIAVFNCVKAVPKALAGNPVQLFECVPDMVRKIQALLRLIPQLSLPLLLVTLIDCIIAALEGIKADLRAIILQQIRILEAGLGAVEPGNVALRTHIDCATGQLDFYLQSVNEGAAPLGRLIGIINFLLELIGLDGIPGPSDIDDPDAALKSLCRQIEILQAIRDSIPL